MLVDGGEKGHDGGGGVAAQHGFELASGKSGAGGTGHWQIGWGWGNGELITTPKSTDWRGGNTTPIAELLVETGCNNLLCDFTGDFDAWSELCRDHGRAMRRNISPHLLQKGPPQDIYDTARTELKNGAGLPGFILGTAVIPFGTPTENILAVKQAIVDAAPA